MKQIKSKPYVEMILYSIDMIIRNVKIELRKDINNLDIGVTAEQFLVLDTIYYYGNIYQQKLSDILTKDKSNTNRILKVLTDKGLITKDADKVNNRLVYTLRITEQGKALVDKYMPKVKKGLMEIFKNITDDEIELLRSLSYKFQSDLSKYSE